MKSYKKLIKLIKTSFNFSLTSRGDHDTVPQYGLKFAMEQNLYHIFLLPFLFPSHFPRFFQT